MKTTGLREGTVDIWRKYSQCRRMAIFGCHQALTPKGIIIFLFGVDTGTLMRKGFSCRYREGSNLGFLTCSVYGKEAKLFTCDFDVCKGVFMREVLGGVLFAESPLPTLSPDTHPNEGEASCRWGTERPALGSLAETGYAQGL